MMDSLITNLGLQAAAAEIFLISAICVILLIDVFLSDRHRWVTYGLSLLTLAGCAWMTVRYGVEARVRPHSMVYEMIFALDGSTKCRL